MRLHLLTLILCICGASGCERATPEGPAPVPGAENAADAPIKTVAVTENVFMLMGRGGNIGVVLADNGVLLIDDKFEDLATPVREAVTRLSPQPISVVVNTHHHGDHTGANVVFGKDATLVAHANARKHLVENKTPRVGLPVITFDETMSIHWGDQELRLVHLPSGHTDGDTAIYFDKSNVVHLGDNFFNGRLPFVDRSSGGDPLALLASTAALIESLPPTIKIIPGHGDLATVEDLRRFHAMLEDTIATVRAAKGAGKSLEQVKTAGFAGKYKAWASGFVSEEKWAATIYQSIP